MTAQNLFRELNKDGHLNGIEVSKDDILDQLGVGNVSITTFIVEGFIDLENTMPAELYDVLVKTTRYEEFLLETIARAEKRMKDAKLAMHKTEHGLIAGFIKNGIKSTEAKSIAKSDPKYLEAMDKYDTLETYVDYLKGFREILDKFHYVIKARVQSMESSYRKER